MNSDEIKRLVEQIHLDRGIETEDVYRCLEEALLTVARRHGSGSDDSQYDITIDRQTGEIEVFRDNVPIPADEITGLIGAQSARQSITQKISEAVRDMVYDRYYPRLLNGQELVTGVVRRSDHRGVTVIIDGDQEAWLPNSNKAARENYRPDATFDFVIENVEKLGSRARVTLSRRNKLLLRRLFERECPEIREGVVEIVECARDAGFRAKVAVRSNDPRIDPVGVCLGVRNARMMEVSNALGGERIDIVLWSPDTKEFIQNALSPARVDEVILCPRVDRALVLVHDDQRSYAVGRRGQNVNLAKKLLGGWELEILTCDGEKDELNELLNESTQRFLSIDGITPQIAEALVAEGFTSYFDLSCIEPDVFMEITGSTPETTAAIIEKAEERADEQERLENAAREQREMERRAKRSAYRRDDKGGRRGSYGVR